MKNNYLLFITFLGLLTSSVVFGQSGCNDLDITSVQDGSVCGGGQVELKATPSGNGDEVVWFASNDASNDTIPLLVGEEYVTPKITSTTSYWVSEALGSVIVEYVDPETPADIGANMAPINSSAFYVSFDVHSPITLATVDVYPSTIGVDASIEILDSSGALIKSVDYRTNVSSIDGSKTQTVSLGVRLDRGVGYRIKQGQSGSVGLFSNTMGASYPYSSSLIDITGNSLAGGYFFFFYNWKYEDVQLDCESSREEVVATVSDLADEEVIAPFPYVHNANTYDYANNYKDGPGDDCGSSENYLEGHDVVYHYKAGDDYLMEIELDSLSKAFSGVFVYTDCADIGVVCAEEGSVVEDSVEKHGFEFIAEDGKDYYFLISSAEPTDSLDYQLTINRMGCNDIPAPSTETINPYFIAGDSLLALNAELKGSKFNQGFRWYEDPGLQNEIMRPDTVSIVDQKDYYVTQTVIDCESDALFISPIEFRCSDLNPDIITPVVELCIPGGYATLEAQPSPAGTDVYWYDSETADNPISKEGRLDVGFVSDSTSYWVTEVRMEGDPPESELGKSSSDALGVVGSGSYAPPSKGYGLMFTAKKAFTLVSVTVLSSGFGGDVEIGLRENDHSGNIIDSKIVNVVSGDRANPVPDELDLNFEIPGPGTYYIYASNGPAMIRNARESGFPYSLGNYGEITSGYSVANVYYFFYDWTIGTGKLICESDKKEVKINVTDNFPDPPKIDSPYIFCGDENYTLGDIEADEGDLQWYDEGGTALIDTTQVQNDEMYYVAVDDSGGCVSDIVPVKVLILDISEQPQADPEQEFNAGEDLASLEVHGVNLRWYADADKEVELSDDTELVDETTYYVTQTRSELCESEVFAITVSELLGVELREFEKLIFAPNPIDEILYVSNPQRIETIDIYDFTGKKIEVSMLLNGDNEAKLDFSKFSQGTYFMRIGVNGRVKTVQVIKR